MAKVVFSFTDRNLTLEAQIVSIPDLPGEFMVLVLKAGDVFDTISIPIRIEEGESPNWTIIRLLTILKLKSLIHYPKFCSDRDVDEILSKTLKEIRKNL